MDSDCIWTGFHRKALKERQLLIQREFPDLFIPIPTLNDGGEYHHSHHQFYKVESTDTTPMISPESSSEDVRNHHQHHSKSHIPSFPIRPLPMIIADKMVENCIGTMGLPIGIVPYIKINGKEVIVPMATEEPSVVAACSSAAKTICYNQEGFLAITTERNTIEAQIQINGVTSDYVDDLRQKFCTLKNEIISKANSFCSRMVSRGGGVIDAYLRVTPRKTGAQQSGSCWAVIHLVIDVRESMGANCANTVAEKTTPFIEETLQVSVGMRIVSNLSQFRMTTCRFRMAVDHLGYKGIDGDEVARRIYEAYCWANDDPYRAVTHNKGIMNGIDAVAIASGQDLRAIEASCHCYASINGSYGSLTKYTLEDGYLCGELSLPLLVGVVGGSIRSNPVHKYTLGLMNNPTSADLVKVKIMVSVGLAQNFAALRALVTTGIQKGHMSLHARNIAIAAGTPTKHVSEVASHLVETQTFTQEAVKEYLHTHGIHEKIK